VIQVLLLAALAQSTSTPSSADEHWPTTAHGRVISSPDWSDYRIYPQAALKKEQEGRVIPELLIGADGKPKACRIVVSSKFAELDAGTCNLAMQMRFEPARDASGAPVPSHYERPFNWGLTTARPFESSTLTARVRIDEGALQECEVVGGEGPYVGFWSTLACWVFSDVHYYFGQHSDEPLTASIDIRLDSGDHAAFLDRPERSGKRIAEEKIAFTISRKGDASQCAPLESSGFGPRGLNNLSPCGRLLSALWFVDPPRDAPPRGGTFETTVTAIEDDPQP
jgi:TonB family protein